MRWSAPPSDKACSARADRSDTFMLCGVQTMAADGLVTIKSGFGPENHEAARSRSEGQGPRDIRPPQSRRRRSSLDLRLRPTDLLIFGNAKSGTPLMQQAQTIGIDLPLKVLVWQDDSGTTWVSYNDPAYLARRHSVGEPTKTAVTAMTAALHAIATKATTAP